MQTQKLDKIPCVGDLVEQYYQEVPLPNYPGVQYKFPLRGVLSHHKVGSCIQHLDLCLLLHIDDIIHHIEPYS